MKPYRLGEHEKRTIVGDWDRGLWIRRSRLHLTPPVCWIHATSSGRPVLCGETSWRTIRGVQARVGTWQVWVQWKPLRRGGR